VDDFLHEANPHDDTIHVLARSSDSWDECAAVSTPRVCAQAVSYNNFSDVEPVNVAILDNDVPGLAITRRKTNATYDTYGTAKSYATYDIALTSQPRAVVTVSVLPSSSYVVVLQSPNATIPSPNITILPENWHQPVTVYLAVSAPTSNRPACKNGGRYCNVLGTSDDDSAGVLALNISHRIRSEDRHYNSLSLDESGFVTVKASVVRDSVDPVQVVSAKFGNLLNTLTIKFDKDTDQGGMNGMFDCWELVQITKEDATALFGIGSTCAFSRRDELEVIFGTDSTVTPYAMDSSMELASSAA